MSPLNLLEVSRAREGQSAPSVIVGENCNLATADNLVDIWPNIGIRQQLPAGETLHLTSDSALDTLAGLGAQTVHVEGLDDNYQEISEIVDMAGVANATTTLTFLRIQSIHVNTAGSTHQNQGTITATYTTAGTVEAKIEPLQGLSQNSHFTIPVNKSYLVIRANLNAVRSPSTASALVTFRAFRQTEGGPIIQTFKHFMDTKVQNSIDLEFPVSGLIEEKTDTWVTAKTDTGTVEVSIRIHSALLDPN